MKQLLGVIFFALTLSGFAFAQDPVNITIDAYTEDSSGNFVQATSASPGDLVEYLVTATNLDSTTLPAQTVQVVAPVPDVATYVAGSATKRAGVAISYSADGEKFSDFVPSTVRAIRWELRNPLEPQQSLELSYRVTINSDAAPNGK